MYDKNEKGHNLANTLSIITLLIISLLSVAFIYLLFFDDNPPIKVASPMLLSTGQARPGDTVIMSGDFCKYTDSLSNQSAYWQREDGLVWGLSKTVTSISNVGCGHVEIPIKLNVDMPPGTWHRVVIAEYKVNFLTKRTVSWKSEQIVVSN